MRLSRWASPNHISSLNLGSEVRDKRSQRHLRSDRDQTQKRFFTADFKDGGGHMARNVDSDKLTARRQGPESYHCKELNSANDLKKDFPQSIQTRN